VNGPFRLRHGGRVDRDLRLAFTFDGRAMTGHPGDTLASALLAGGVRLVGRSFKLHRPRGVVADGIDEPNALVELRDGARREPNSRATVIELFDGLSAASQNRWPSLAFDLRSLNGLVAPALMAGFYYKTFMWPASFWEKVYEPAIRKAAGLGSAARAPDPDRYETVHDHCDLLVVGAGPAGLAAARVAGRAGRRVLLVEQDFAPGGGLLSSADGQEWLATALADLATTPNVRLLLRTQVFGAYDHNVHGALERVGDHLPEPAPHQPRQRYRVIRAREAIFATGAHERLIAFPGNDLPGVMLAGAVTTYVRRFGVAPGGRAVLFANHDAAYDAVFALQDSGVAVAGVVDPRADSAAMAAAAARGIAVHAESEVARTHGFRTLTGVTVRRLGGLGATAIIPCDLLAMSSGWNPAIQLASHLRTQMAWDEARACFTPAEGTGGTRSVGAAAGVTGLAACAADGARAAGGGADWLGPDGAFDTRVRPLWEVAGAGKSFVDLQDDVTAADIRLAHREGYTHIEHAKRYTTHAMGTDQGRSGGMVGAAVLAAARGVPVREVGLPAFRPFVSPVTWGAIAGATVGADFEPVRRVPLHRWHERAGAVFMETGPWLRPAYYRMEGATDVWEPILREARAVRQAVGICDVSTLGKIDIQGRDAGRFLDLVYTNSFSTLKVGRARYGLMLREDGLVFDDGTTTRLGPDHFFMTTTTANAGPVMAHLEFHLQTCWPEFEVMLTSVTDQWAAMSVAGPKARDTLAAVVRGVDLANEALPFMGVADATIAGLPVRLFRISFSGELAYEVATPAGHAETVWQCLIDAGAPFGILPYGLEALSLLRIEKGHVAGSELNGQTTATDLGLGRMMKKQGDFIGRVLAGRPGLTNADRPRLVGIRPVRVTERLRAGAHFVAAPGGASEGHVTCVTRAVEFDGWIGLGLLRRGAERLGDRVWAAHPLAGELVEVEVVSPHFIDPENRRVHG
jgi:sarcosine oxidase subunit alpha